VPIFLFFLDLINEKKLKESCFLIFTICVSSCASAKETQQGRYFTHVINQYFGEYQPNEKIWVDKPESKYSITKIKKSNLSLNDFSNIRKKLEVDGWKLISDQDSYYEYCLGKKIYIGILYPIRSHHYNSEGREVKYTDINDWLVGLSYGASGVNQCRKDEIPVIKLD
jgi:hypothetical protein